MIIVLIGNYLAATGEANGLGLLDSLTIAIVMKWPGR
jgi:hypothetical protein